MAGHSWSTVDLTPLGKLLNGVIATSEMNEFYYNR